jgi:hypothetical protein
MYYLVNRNNRSEDIEARFRVSGKLPEIWRADTGTMEPVTYRVENGTTILPLKLLAEDSFFVVFRKAAAKPSLTVASKTFAAAATFVGEWNVAFHAAIKLAKLGSLSEQTEPSVKYFSGTATYTKSFALPSAARPGAPLLLNLGTVGDLAEVRVNGRVVGTVWHAPYRIDIGAAVKRGQNQLEIRVANLWVNRFVGDSQPNATRIAYTAMPTYTAKAPLRPSGLIGPVTLETTR